MKDSPLELWEIAAVNEEFDVEERATFDTDLDSSSAGIGSVHLRLCTFLELLYCLSKGHTKSS